MVVAQRLFCPDRIKFHQKDAPPYVYTLTHSKTNQSGQDRPEDVKPLVGTAALAMQAWLAASGIKEGALFRRIRKGGHLGEPLAPAAVRDMSRNAVRSRVSRENILRTRCGRAL